MTAIGAISPWVSRQWVADLSLTCR